jgi:malate dehydrogenase
MAEIPQRKLTVVGAGNVGATAALLAAQKELAAEIVLVDVVEGRPQGVALDLNQAAAVEGFASRLRGTNDPADTRDSDLVIMTAGLPRKPGMSRSDLLEVNGKIVVQVADYVRAGSPEAVVIVVTNPLDSMVHLFRARSGLPAKRVVGMAGVLDSARLSWFVREASGASVQDVDAMVLGAHGDSMVPVPGWCTVNGVPISNLVDGPTIERLVQRTRGGGAEIVNLLKTGSAYYAPAASSVAMAASILNDQRRLLPCACLLNGQYGIEGLYMGVPAILGRGGVERIVELPLALEARAAMQRTAGEIHKDVGQLRTLGLL